MVLIGGTQKSGQWVKHEDAQDLCQKWQSPVTITTWDSLARKLSPCKQPAKTDVEACLAGDTLSNLQQLWFACAQRSTQLSHCRKGVPIDTAVFICC